VNFSGATGIFTLGSHVERLTLTHSTANTSGTGNTLANTITGNAGGNVLNGGGASDTLIGGNGNDTYVIDRMVDATDDTIQETGTVASAADVVQFTGSANGQVYTLGANLERLTLLGTFSTNGTGNTLANIITGNAGANVLNGKAGLDTLQGQGGNDTYVINRVVDGATTDGISELLNAGSDTVQFTGNSINQGYTLGANVENLTILGSLATNGTGNISANTIIGNAGANILNGMAGLDTLKGFAGNDIYIINRLIDGATIDTVTELANAGTDTVQFTASAANQGYQLGANVENLTILGTLAANGFGNTGVNTFIGNRANNAFNGGNGNDNLNGGAGNDTLTGGAGRDALNGGAGRDIFDLNASSESARGVNRDIISGFSRTQDDRIDLRTIDADRDGTAGNQAFKFIGSAAFSRVDGQLRFSGGVLQGDTNGDRIADFEIKVTGVSSMVGGDFFL
jgi:Ca2+-binding RTX toxin-like protein